MMEVCIDMRFQRSTFHVAIAYTDRFFEKSQHMLSTDHLQLAGVTALYISSKMEEVYVPEIKYFSKATNYSSSLNEICAMERQMMKVLGFKLFPVTLVSMLDWYTL